MAEAKKEIAIRENYSLDKIKDMTAMAQVLKAHVVGHRLYTNIKGKNYCQVEGWQFAGGLMGLYPKVAKVTNLSNDKEIKWSADVEIIDRKTGNVVGNGFALCSNKESIKKSFDEYAILSMAQTRSIGKAYRNLIGWVMKLAGYESTPAEEMMKGNQEPTIQMDAEPVSVTGCVKLSKAKTEAELIEVWTKLTASEKRDDEVVALKEELKKKFKKNENKDLRK